MLTSHNNTYFQPFLWALFVAFVMRLWGSEHTGERLIYEALTAIAMLLAMLVVLGFFIAIKIDSTKL